VRQAQRQAYKEQMDALLSAPNFDENAAKELLTARQDKKQQLGLIKLKTQHQVMQLLNAEQKEKLAKIQQRMAKKHRKHKA
jgi:protein CpxP